MAYVKYEDILNGTDGGLNIIRTYYPRVDEGLHRRDKKFKIREEKTASASVRQKEDGWYYVTDFGGDQKERHAIAICMLEDNLDFKEACAQLGARFQIKGAETQWVAVKPHIEKRALQDDEEVGQYIFKYKDFTEAALALLGPYVSDLHCQEYKLHNIDSFAHVKKNEVVVTTATDEYPIFCFDYGTWQKIYQPMSFEKQFRFRYAGSKPQKFWFGMDLIKKEFVKRKEAIAKDEEDEAPGHRDTDPRLDSCFIVSGGSDGLNLRSFGHFPVWANSETDELTWEEYKLLKTWCKEIYYIADLDVTGKRMALKTGLQFLDIRLVWLPKSLLKYKDRRGNACKDFKDLVVKTCKDRKKFSNKINKLFENSLPLQFWSVVPSDKGYKYNFKNTQAYHFLQQMGFGRYRDDNEKDGYLFIKIEGNFVKEIKAHVIEDFVIDFVKDQPTDLRDMIFKTSYLSERAMAKLPMIDIDFSDADRDTQYLFFRKEVWEIKASGIKAYRPGEVNKFIWDDKVINHQVKLEEAPFRIFKDPHGDLDIEIQEKDCMFFNYLINTSRMHWRKELEDKFENRPEAEEEAYYKANQFNIAGPNLNADEQLEQKLHLINKIYSIGYTLHKYKNESKAWCVFAMDNKLSDLGEAHGGSGKSLCYGYLNNVLSRRFYLKGRDPKLTQNDFIYHGVTEDTDYIFIDDAHQYLNFNFFFSEITGSLKVNPKNGKPYEIPFDKAPKFVITSNFTARDLDPSTERRLLYTVFSDYYHYNSNDEYKQVRQVSDDFGGKNLFRDFDAVQWNKYFNFLAYCIQFFLEHPGKIEPPMNNVKKRNLISEMGNDFMEWASVFFEKKDITGHYLNLDQDVAKQAAYDDFVTTSRSKMKVTTFKKALKAFAQYNGWVFNPKSRGLDKNDRIIKKTDNGSEEFFYFDTKLNGQPYIESEDGSPKTEDRSVTDDFDIDDDNLDF